MRFARLLPPVGLALAIAACQAAPAPMSPAPSAVPSGTAAPSTPSSTLAPTAIPTAPPSTATVQVSGKVYDDEGHLLDNAQMELRGADGVVLRTAQAIGGA